jgi:hypothetical protein
MGQLSGRIRDECFGLFAQIIPHMRERSISGANLSRSPAFMPLGITDSCIFDLATTPYLILTDDFHLYNRLEKQRVDVLNFNHIRTLSY